MVHETFMSYLCKNGFYDHISLGKTSLKQVHKHLTWQDNRESLKILEV